MNRKSLFWIGPAALLSLISIGVGPLDAAQARKAKRTTAARTSASSPRTGAAKPAQTARSRRALYSAERSLTRKAALARARAIATAREMADTLLPRYKVDASGEIVPDVHAAAAIIYDPDTKEVLWEENSQSLRSIASITKVMTATVFLENNPDFTQPVVVMKSDVFAASTTHLRLNDRVTVDDLLHLLLIASDNAAARALARVSPYGTEGFIRRMNEKAAELGLQSTSYADPSGLLSDNVSSAFDMAQLIAHASADDRIASIMRLPEYTIYTDRRRVITFRSTNHLLGRDDLEVRAAKTGFIGKSGYCLATLLRLPSDGHEVAVVVLGARSNAARFMETRNLFSWLSVKASTIFATKTSVPVAAVTQAPQ